MGGYPICYIGKKKEGKQNKRLGARKMAMLTGFPTEVTTKVEKTGRDGMPTGWPARARAVGYVRQDFDEMGKKWTRPEGQKGRIAGCADCHGWHLVSVHEDVGWAGDCLSRPGLVSLLAHLDFDILVIDRTDRLTCKKEDLDFLLALLEEHNITCVPATWSWEPLAQYMRWWYRRKENPVYAQLDTAAVEAAPAKS
jgi:hypothetical protein